MTMTKTSMELSVLEQALKDTATGEAGETPCLGVERKAHPWEQGFLHAMADAAFLTLELDTGLFFCRHYSSCLLYTSDAADEDSSV